MLLIPLVSLSFSASEVLFISFYNLYLLIDIFYLFMNCSSSFCSSLSMVSFSSFRIFKSTDLKSFLVCLISVLSQGQLLFSCSVSGFYPLVCFMLCDFALKTGYFEYYKVIILGNRLFSLLNISPPCDFVICLISFINYFCKVCICLCFEGFRENGGKSY